MYAATKGVTSMGTAVSLAKSYAYAGLVTSRCGHVVVTFSGVILSKYKRNSLMDTGFILSYHLP
jgi:hypothetical protein